MMKKSQSNESIPRFMQWGCGAMIDKDVMVLQNCTNSAMELRDPCGEPNPASRDASQVINIKVEEVSDAEEDEGPVPISFPKIKAESEVRRMSLMSTAKSKAIPAPGRGGL
jgi:hypothetical protein